MFRRIAGWLMALQEPSTGPKFACSIGWHRPGMFRLAGRYYPTDCAELRCPVFEAAKEAARARLSAGGPE